MVFQEWLRINGEVSALLDRASHGDVAADAAIGPHMKHLAALEEQAISDGAEPASLLTMGLMTARREHGADLPLPWRLAEAALAGMAGAGLSAAA